MWALLRTSLALRLIEDKKLTCMRHSRVKAAGLCVVWDSGPIYSVNRIKGPVFGKREGREAKHTLYSLPFPHNHIEKGKNLSEG